MPKKPRTLPYAETKMAKFLTARLSSLKGELTQAELASRLGYPHGNIISMFKTGETRVPFEKIPALAEALDVDLAHLVRLGLEQYWPDKMRVIGDVFGRIVTSNEMRLLEAIRDKTGDSDPKLSLVGNELKLD